MKLQASKTTDYILAFIKKTCCLFSCEEQLCEIRFSRNFFFSFDSRIIWVLYVEVKSNFITKIQIKNAIMFKQFYSSSCWQIWRFLQAESSEKNSLKLQRAYFCCTDKSVFGILDVEFLTIIMEFAQAPSSGLTLTTKLLNNSWSQRVSSAITFLCIQNIQN